MIQMFLAKAYFYFFTHFSQIFSSFNYIYILKVRLDAKWGQFIHTANMLTLPLLPVIILFIHNMDEYFNLQYSRAEIANVRQQVRSIFKSN